MPNITSKTISQTNLVLYQGIIGTMIVGGTDLYCTYQFYWQRTPGATYWCADNDLLGPVYVTLCVWALRRRWQTRPEFRQVHTWKFTANPGTWGCGTGPVNDVL